MTQATYLQGLGDQSASALSEIISAANMMHSSHVGTVISEDVISFHQSLSNTFDLEQFRQPIKRTARGGVLKPFPDKLYSMLETIESQAKGNIVSWLPHGRAFIVRIPKIFVQDVLPVHFKQSKLTSFQRQLNLYGFCRITVGRDAGAYFHPLFLQGYPGLCIGIFRTKVKGTGISRTCSKTSASSVDSKGPSAVSQKTLGHVLDPCTSVPDPKVLAAAAAVVASALYTQPPQDTTGVTSSSPDAFLPLVQGMMSSHLAKRMAEHTISKNSRTSASAMQPLSSNIETTGISPNSAIAAAPLPETTLSKLIVPIPSPLEKLIRSKKLISSTPPETIFTKPVAPTPSPLETSGYYGSTSIPSTANPICKNPIEIEHQESSINKPERSISAENVYDMVFGHDSINHTQHKSQVCASIVSNQSDNDIADEILQMMQWDDGNGAF
eukprot:CAMPEP_0194268906 /NCGR_PEP_ID=MMETSP0169-20130528/3171_1 /TAXON_ID=218684 /ORGANISM="Corethron pennatum, Strain L29A3" /LENGTH=439 /DNA_ID=CAMNT_0039010361 /DNA_START=186 /DNA_END=1505 /DNA_ORIENTATION=+